MKITSSYFEISAAAPSQFPAPGLPEIVFVGRSNVGKSSLLNALTRQKKLAKVSGTPGKTRLINFFRIGNALRFVDLPGYGYAQVGKGEREQWRALIERYLDGSRPIRLVLVLIDARIPMQAIDQQMIAWLEAKGLPLAIVLTKIDKLTQKERASKAAEVIESYPALRDSIAQVSSTTGAGVDALVRLMFHYVSDDRSGSVSDDQAASRD